MRNKLLVIIFFVLSAVVSCQKETKIDIQIKPNSVSANRGDTLMFKYSLVPDASNKGKIGSLKISDSQGTIVLSKNFSSSETVKDSCKYIVPNVPVGINELSLIFSVTDEKSGIESVKNANIKLGESYPITLNVKDVQAFFDKKILESKFIFELKPTDIYTHSGNFNEGQLAFIWSNQNGFSIVSPDAVCIQKVFAENNIVYQIDNKQVTNIMKFNGLWTDLNDKTINEMTIETQIHQNGGNGVGLLKENDILIFETADKKKGALIIKAVIRNKKYISADFKYQI